MGQMLPLTGTAGVSFGIDKEGTSTGCLRMDDEGGEAVVGEG